MSVKRLRSGENALERGLDPMGLCSICGLPFSGFDLQDDHVMPIGARVADEGLVLVRVSGEFSACLPSEAPPGVEVFAPVPCAALAHASCNMSKGATRDISRWRHQSLAALVVAINESGERVALPPLQVLEPSPELDWADAQREAYDRGVEALRRRGHRGARELQDGRGVAHREVAFGARASQSRCRSRGRRDDSTGQGQAGSDDRLVGGA